MPLILQVGAFICLLFGLSEIRSNLRDGNLLLALGFVLATLGTGWVWYYVASNW
jgi:hypothetical protein